MSSISNLGGRESLEIAVTTLEQLIIFGRVYLVVATSCSIKLHITDFFVRKHPLIKEFLVSLSCC